MAGEYYGYDGPCPPWNDERVHTYVFTLYALDIPRLPLEGRFTGKPKRAWRSPATSSTKRRSSVSIR
jgi:phosphatidylethanolamine-binding protein (PEBP) family uncharacterized protein